MITADNITDVQLILLKDYLTKNANFLASENRIKLDNYYANDNKKKWTIVDLYEFGEVKIYLTNSATILKINGTEVLPKSRCRDIDFFSVYFPLRVALIDFAYYKKTRLFENNEN